MSNSTDGSAGNGDSPPNLHNTPSRWQSYIFYASRLKARPLKLYRVLDSGMVYVVDKIRLRRG
jgi:hypothetical protein